MIVVVISSKKESPKREYPSYQMISSYLFPETYEDDDIYRKYKYALPPAEDTDIELIVELINHRESRGRYSDESYNSQIRKILDTLQVFSYFL